MPGFPGNRLYARDPFVRRFVRQHLPRNHVADRVDPFHICAEMFVHFDPFLFVELNANFFRAEPFAKWPAPDRNKDFVSIELEFFFSFGRGRRHAAIVDRDRAHFGFEMKRDPLRGERALEHVRQLQVEADGDARQKFENRYLRSESGPN